jgi:hypothetical protein
MEKLIALEGVSLLLEYLLTSHTTRKLTSVAFTCRRRSKGASLNVFLPIWLTACPGDSEQPVTEINIFQKQQSIRKQILKKFKFCKIDKLCKKNDIFKAVTSNMK